MSSAHPIAVLVSGGGRSLENLAELSRGGELPCRLALVVSDRPRVFALERAERLGIPHRVIERQACADVEEFSTRVFDAVDQSGCELVVLAGFLRLLRLPAAWQGRVMNIHPALLPKYGGKGYYGDRVHAAVLEAGERESGCTVHYVDNSYDTGPHILQRRVPVLPDDDVHSLAARVFEQERLALPEAIRRHFAAG